MKAYYLLLTAAFLGAPAAPVLASEDTEAMLRMFNAHVMLRNALRLRVPANDPLAHALLERYFDEDEVVRRIGAAIDGQLPEQDIERFRTFAASPGGRVFAAEVRLLDPALNLPAHALPASIAADFEAYRSDGAFDRYRLAVASNAALQAFADYMATQNCAAAKAEFPERAEKVCALAPPASAAAAAPEAEAAEEAVDEVEAEAETEAETETETEAEAETEADADADIATPKGKKAAAASEPASDDDTDAASAEALDSLEP